MNYVLSVLQALLALFFGLASGAPKLFAVGLVAAFVAYGSMAPGASSATRGIP